MHPSFHKFAQFLSKNFFIPESLIQPYKRFRNDLGLNSIEFLEMIVFIEQTYGIEIDDRDLEKINTVQELNNYLEARLQLQPQMATM